MTKESLAQMLQRGVVNQRHRPTLRELASHLGVSHEHVRRYLSGVYVPDARTLSKLCERLGLDFSKAKAVADEERKEFGLAQRSMSDATFRVLAGLWQFLTPKQRDVLMQDAVDIYRRKKRRAAANKKTS